MRAVGVDLMSFFKTEEQCEESQTALQFRSLSWEWQSQEEADGIFLLLLPWTLGHGLLFSLRVGCACFAC